MKKKSRIEFGSYLGITILVTLMIATVGKAPVGPQNSEVGFAGMNVFFHTLFGEHFLWYQITEVFGVIAILIMGCFALLGLCQWIKRKSLKKVDRELWALAGVYVLLVGLYAFFEKFVINYRPVIMPGETALEASFPSSHTMLICTVCLTTIESIKHLEIFAKKQTLQTIIRVVCAVMLALTVFGRLYCGVHWFTDIVAGLFYAITLAKFYEMLIDRLNS